jgi:hypothetical protein
VTVIPVNDRPVLPARFKTTLTTVAPGATDPAGDTVVRLLGTSVTDPDAGALQGVAIVAAGGLGAWQYRLLGQAWSNVGVVSAGAALLLAPEDGIRFVPQPGFTGVASLSYRAWDQTSGTAGGREAVTPTSTAFSLATATARLVVTSANTPPVLTTTRGPALTPVLPDAVSPTGNAVADLLAGCLLDPDAGAQPGIALTAVNNALGTWQYSSDGIHWLDVGPVTPQAALLLRAEDRLRFLPTPGVRGVASISYRGWDRTAGSAGDRVDVTSPGASAFSAATAVAVVTVNTAPVLAG